METSLVVEGAGISAERLLTALMLQWGVAAHLLYSAPEIFLESLDFWTGQSRFRFLNTVQQCVRVQDSWCIYCSFPRGTSHCSQESRARGHGRSMLATIYQLSVHSGLVSVLSVYCLVQVLVYGSLVGSKLAFWTMMATWSMSIVDSEFLFRTLLKPLPTRRHGFGT